MVVDDQNVDRCGSHARSWSGAERKFRDHLRASAGYGFDRAPSADFRRALRASENRLEVTVTIDDPKTYTRPWVALDKLPLTLLPPTADIMEMMNAASEVQAVAASFKAEPKK